MTDRPTRRWVVGGLIGAALATSVKAQDGTIHDVEIKSFAFAPARLAVKVGDSIRWTNQDLSPHTATAEDGSWDTGPIEQGQSVVLEVTAAMAAEYHCLFHPNMTAGLAIEP